MDFACNLFRQRRYKETRQLWEKKSVGKSLFIVVEKTVDGKDMRSQLMEKIGA